MAKTIAATEYTAARSQNSLVAFVVMTSGGEKLGGPETVVVHNASVALHPMLWRPQGRGPFPAILLNHGRVAVLTKSWNASDRTNRMLETSVRSSLAMVMYSCTCSGAALAFPRIRALAPLS